MLVVGVLLLIAAVGCADARLQGEKGQVEFDSTNENEGSGLISPFEDENGIREDAPQNPRPRRLFKIFGIPLLGEDKDEEETADDPDKETEKKEDDGKKKDKGGVSDGPMPWWAKEGLGEEKPPSSSDSMDDVAGNLTKSGQGQVPVVTLFPDSPRNSFLPSNRTVPPEAYANGSSMTMECSAKEHECDMEYGGKGVYVCRKIPEELRLGNPHSHVTKCLKPDMALTHDKCGCCLYGCTPRCPCPCEVKQTEGKHDLPKNGWSHQWKMCVPEDDLDTMVGVGSAKCDMSCVVENVAKDIIKNFKAGEDENMPEKSEEAKKEPMATDEAKEPVETADEEKKSRKKSRKRPFRGAKKSNSRGETL